MKITRTILVASIISTVIACGSKKTTAAAVKENNKTEKVIAEKAAVAPFFTAESIQSDWKLVMSTDEIKMTSNNKAQNFTLPFHKAESVGNNRIYNMSYDDTQIEITIAVGECEIKGSNHTVKVVYKTPNAEEVITKGCGKYIPDTILDGVWTLSQLKGQKVSPADFGNELPYIDLHTEISAFTGFAGCNRIKGQLEIFENNNFKFGPIIATKMACLPDNKENVFMQAIQSITKVDVQERYLILSNGEGVQAIFIKKA
ncbi:MAG: META domain-containing protein [Flavobacterium sp.]|nr:META domain-containing protein [Flavobacterium sp.]